MGRSTWRRRVSGGGTLGLEATTRVWVGVQGGGCRLNRAGGGSWHAGQA
jgi:hypothetical protein